MQVAKTFKIKHIKSYEEWLDKFMPSSLNEQEINHLEHLIHKQRNYLLKSLNNENYNPSLIGA